MEPVAARAAMDAREALTALVTPPDRAGVANAVAEAARLRKEYGVRTAEQRAPFFEVHGLGFSLIAADTGILRASTRRRPPGSGRPRASAWPLHDGHPGHPFFVGGAYQGDDDDFGAIHRVLRRHRVPVVMAATRTSSSTTGRPTRISPGAGSCITSSTAGAARISDRHRARLAGASVRDWAFYPSTIRPRQARRRD